MTLRFGVSGLLHRNGLVMYDRETDTLWSHVLGTALRGTLAGARLRVIPLVHTTWGEWSRAHPKSVVLEGPLGPDAYAGYYASPRTGVMSVRGFDARLPPKERVLGVFVPGHARAYPMSRLRARGMVQDRFAGRSVLVVYEASADGAAAFDREDLDFVLRNGRLVDRGTGSAWDPLRGEAVTGPLAGRRLQRIPQTLAFWFAWRDYYPATELYEEAGE